MGIYLVVHTPIKHGREGKVEIYEPDEDIELTAKEAKRLGDNVRPKSREVRAEPSTSSAESPEAEPRPETASSPEGLQAGEESPIPLEDMTVPQLTAALEEKGVEVPPKTRKADLIEMLKKAEAEEG